MSAAPAKKRKVVWTVARMLTVLAAGVRGRGRKASSIQDIQARYGIGIRDLLRLAHRLSQAEDFSPAGQLPLQLFFDQDEGAVRLLGSQGAEHLLRLSRLSKADTLLAADALENLAVDPKAAEASRRLALKLRKAVGSGSADPPFLYRPSDPAPTLAKVALVEEAMKGSRTLAFEYRGPSSKSAGRVGDPLSLRRDNGAWRVLCWDRYREALRTFAVDHMAKIVVTEHVFEWPKGVSPEAAKARDLSRYQPTGKETEVRMRVSRQVAQDWKGAFKKVSKPGKDGFCDAVVMAASLDWLVRSFLPMVDEVRVLAPEKARQLWRAEIAFLAERS
jgi:predicted DNA-binding transcriptional regulator YafY